MAKLNSQQALLQSSVSHDPSESILIGWYTKKIFVEDEIHFSELFDEFKVKKQQLN